MTAIANGVNSLTSIRHSIKRVSRFLCIPNVDPTEAMQALCTEAEALGKPTVVALDRVELRAGMRPRGAPRAFLSGLAPILRILRSRLVFGALLSSG